jgi:prepilin-type processing-associated H-X9-DG protein
MTLEDRLAEMRSRALFNYIDSYSKVWECPEDKGLDFGPDGPFFGPTLYHAFGLSYRLNAYPWENTKYVVDGVLPGQVPGWVKQPSDYIYVYEPPAQPSGKPLLNPDVCHLKPGPVEPYNYFHWHFNTGPPSVFDIAKDHQKMISPILFVDGHVKQHDFSTALRTDWRYPTEATTDWMWYQPKIGPDGAPIPAAGPLQK